VFHNETGSKYKDGYETLIRAGVGCFVIGGLAVSTGTLLLLFQDHPNLIIQDLRFILKNLASIGPDELFGLSASHREHMLTAGVALVLLPSVFIDLGFLFAGLSTETLYLRFMLLGLTRLNTLYVLCRT